MAVVSRCSRWIKTCINDLKMFGGNKQYPEQLKTNEGADSMHIQPLRAGSTMKGGHHKQLVKEKEFRKYFANSYAYGIHGEKWPTKTILLYRYSSNATTKYQDIPEDTWKRLDNEPKINDVDNGRHAELIMIEDLRKIQDYLYIQPIDYEGRYNAILSLEVILSYSPCADCSKRLCLEKEEMDKRVKQSKKKYFNSVQENLSAVSPTTEVEEEETIKMKITFSNFYMHNEISNKEGLKNLLKSDIKLDIFTDDNWKYFFNAAGLVTKRQIREKADKKILQDLYKELVDRTATHNWEELYQI
ncbi:uncharacterized protein LOC127717648 [Mytilus californianus]|uniref:uncharacterized protein LOC127717648 n=1 Tax=Mytilus californianus TaxID=6549 RepID=UPI0022477FE2|nr:uncharacterized protein LOC127717648 [Mytilus californianus]